VHASVDLDDKLDKGVSASGGIGNNVYDTNRQRVGGGRGRAEDSDSGVTRNRITSVLNNDTLEPISARP
jgi:hypothetical protein